MRAERDKLDDETVVVQRCDNGAAFNDSEVSDLTHIGEGIENTKLESMVAAASDIGAAQVVGGSNNVHTMADIKHSE
eukprot:2187738-Karenia_brevis.AAC.1